MATDEFPKANGEKVTACNQSTILDSVHAEVQMSSSIAHAAPFELTAERKSPAFQAYQILRLAFTVAPIEILTGVLVGFDRPGGLTK
jgi:hypothetical protein